MKAARNIAFLLVALCALMTSQETHAVERQRYNFNIDWLMQIGDPAGAQSVSYADGTWKKVSLPHAFNEDEAYSKEIAHHTDTVCWYRKHFILPAEAKGQKVFLEFEGARQYAQVFVNGQKVGESENGVMAFGFDITRFVKAGRENVVAVRADNDWTYKEKSSGSRYQWNDRNFNANYGGLPKNVWLHIAGQIYQTLPLLSNLGTTGVYVYAKQMDIAQRSIVLHAESQVRNESKKPITVAYEVEVLDADGKRVCAVKGDKKEIGAGATTTLTAESKMEDVHFWSWGYGYLYTVRTRLVSNGKTIDEVSTRTGFRKTRFAEGKFWLNDRVLQLKGFAQRTSNEWPAVGLSVPAWLSDYSNHLMTECNGNLVRWMHITPWKQDIESCDRVGLIEAMPAGDAEKDVTGPRWEQRKKVMRDAIVYNRNNPSVIFYEGGNESISREHMIELRAIRDSFDLYGGRAIGSREMLDIREAEYGGEMLYINKSAHSPMWAMEYCRDEGVRKYWDEMSAPYHKEGTGSTIYKSVNGDKRKVDTRPYNHNQDEMTIENVRRWYDYYRERPGTGRRTSAGGVRIVFSDTNTHYRGELNYRTSGDVDAMRIAKDCFFAHRVMWNGWVDIEKPDLHIVGHWNYESGDSTGARVRKPIYVVSNTEEVVLTLNGKEIPMHGPSYGFLFTSDTVAFEAGTVSAIGKNGGKEVCRASIETAGKPERIRLRQIARPTEWATDGADLVLLEVEVVDSKGRRCPLDNSEISFSIGGPAEWRGGIAMGKGETGLDNHILAKRLPVECGVNRVLLRSTRTAGKVTVEAQGKGLKGDKVEIESHAIDVKGGLTLYSQAQSLRGNLGRGETPRGASYCERTVDVGITGATAGCNQATAVNSYDDNELSEWRNDGKGSTAWITYHLERRAKLDEICLKLTGWRMRSYDLEIYASIGDIKSGKETGKTLIWSGKTEQSLGYIHLPVKEALADNVTIRVRGASQESDAFGGIVEVAAPQAGELDLYKAKDGDKPRMELRIVEVEFKEYVGE